MLRTSPAPTEPGGLWRGRSWLTAALALLAAAPMVCAVAKNSAASRPGGGATLLVFGQRQWAAGRRCAVRVVVREGKSAAPLSGATVAGALRLRGQPPRELFRVVTDETGSAPLSFIVPVAAGRALLTVTATVGDAKLTAAAQVTIVPDRRLSLFPAASACRAGGAAPVSLLLADPHLGKGAPTPECVVRLLDGAGKVHVRRTARLAPNRVFALALSVPAKTPPGRYRVTATVLGLTATGALEVAPESGADTQVELQLFTAPCCPGESVKMRVTAFSAVGRPVPGREVQIRVATDGKGKRTLIHWQGVTDEKGGASFAFRLPELVGTTGPLVFTAAVKDGAGRWRTVTRLAPVRRREVPLPTNGKSPSSTGDRPALVSVDQSLKTTGETMELTVHVSKSKGVVPAALDLFCDGRYVAALTALVRNGVARVTAPLDGELTGLVRVVAYPLRLPKQRCPVDDAFVWVRPPATAPARGGVLTGWLRLPDALPCAATAAVEHDLREARRLLLSAVAGTPTAASDLRTLLARLPARTPFDLLLDTGYEARRRYHEQGLQSLRRARFEFVYALQEFANRTGRLPEPENALSALFRAKVLKPDNTLDPWGRGFVLAPIHGGLADFELRSLGADGRPGTPDDLALRCDAFDADVAIDPAPLPPSPPWQFVSRRTAGVLSPPAARLVEQVMSGVPSLDSLLAIRSLWGAEAVGARAKTPPGPVGERFGFDWKLTDRGPVLTVTPGRRAAPTVRGRSDQR